MGWTYCSKPDLAGAGINGFSISDLLELMLFLFIFNIYYYYYFTVKCPFEVSKVWVNYISELWGARDSGLFTTYRSPNCALVSFLSPVFKKFLWTLFGLHNNPLIYRNFGITDPIWPVTTERLRAVVIMSVTQLFECGRPWNPNLLMLNPFNLFIKIFMQLLDMCIN